jgi:hypothetical protein
MALAMVEGNLMSTNNALTRDHAAAPDLLWPREA